jgi:hypothetical protein
LDTDASEKHECHSFDIGYIPRPNIFVGQQTHNKTWYSCP